MTQANPIRLKQAGIDSHPGSFCDDVGRLFTHQGKLYRALLQPGLEVWQAPCNSGLNQEMIEAGLLIDTQPARIGVQGYEHVVQHRRLPYSYPAQWCPSMLRDAALCVLEMQYRLIAKGLIAIDTNPLIVDFTSRVRRSHASTSRSKDWAPYTLNHPIRALRKIFSSVQTVLLSEDGSALLWCDKTNQDSAKGRASYG